MGRINLYIADTLEERMAGFKDRLNWSRIAQVAFEQAIKLEELKGTNMEAGKLERLRQSKMTSEERHEASGFAIGKTWALDSAEYDELERVASIDTDWGSDDPRASAQYELAKAILDDDRPSPRDCAECLESIFNTENPSIAQIEGFIGGATEVYAEV